MRIHQQTLEKQMLLLLQTIWRRVGQNCIIIIWKTGNNFCHFASTALSAMWWWSIFVCGGKWTGAPNTNPNSNTVNSPPVEWWKQIQSGKNSWCTQSVCQVAKSAMGSDNVGQAIKIKKLLWLMISKYNFRIHN